MNVWGCFSEQGFGLYLFTNNLNVEKMLKIYSKALLPSVQRWYINKDQDWILQEDNDPKHRSQLCRAWKAQTCDIETLNWPSQSPDANPIENVWSPIKRKLRGRQTSTIKRLITEIRRIWRSLPHKYAMYLVESMPRRCEMSIINAGDDWTYY